MTSPTRLLLLAGLAGLAGSLAVVARVPRDVVRGPAPAVEDGRAELVLRLGLGVDEKPSANYRRLRPWSDALEARLGERLGRPVRIEWVQHKTDEQAIASLAGGDVDLARLEAAAYVTARARAPGIRLLAKEEYADARHQLGAIVVGRHVDAACLEDLRGRRFAFGSPDSARGRYLPQAQLVGARVDAGALGDFAFLGRPDRVAASLEVGDFDAGASSYDAVEEAAVRGDLRVLLTYALPPPAWVASERLTPELAEALRASLLAVATPGRLCRQAPAGFAGAEDADYDAIRRAMFESTGFHRDHARP